jgi:Cof subfamily protein (haloacid dehalogenase superfamily)
VENEKTLYISDLDGTLLNRSAEVSEFTANVLNNMMAKGLNFTVATGRPLAPVTKMLSCLSLNLPAVLLNGVLIYDFGKQKYVEICALLPEAVNQVIDALRDYKLEGFLSELINDEMIIYYEFLGQKLLRDFVEERAVRYNQIFRRIDSFYDIRQNHIIYFTFLDTLEHLQPFNKALSALPQLGQALSRHVYGQDSWFLEIFNARASKKNAVEYLRKAYGFERIIGFGDNLNDLPMFEACDVKVAVGNAEPEVKAAADFICDANDNDGVAKWLEDYA